MTEISSVYILGLWPPSPHFLYPLKKIRKESLGFAIFHHPRHITFISGQKGIASLLSWTSQEEAQYLFICFGPGTVYFSVLFFLGF